MKYGFSQCSITYYRCQYFLISTFTNGDCKIFDDMVTASRVVLNATCTIISSILLLLTTQGSWFFESWQSITISRRLGIYMLGKFYDKEEFSLCSQSHLMKRIDWRGVYGNSLAQEVKTNPEFLSKRKKQLETRIEKWRIYYLTRKNKERSTKISSLLTYNKCGKYWKEGKSREH